MAKHIGVKLPEDLIPVLKEGKTVGVFATFSEKGLPNITPIQCLYPKRLENILISIHKEYIGYHNMVWQKKVMLCFMDVNNVIYSILERTGVVCAPSNIHSLMNIVRINIIDINSDRSLLMCVDSGVRCSYTSWEAE
jgi:hypothetical protein